jgi:hypothetical protein
MRTAKVRTLVALALLSVSFSLGQGEEGDGDVAPSAHVPGTMYLADEGALEWADMSPRERETTDAIREWAETRNGGAVHDAFSAAVATTTALRLVEQAQDASGLDGVETLGVIP